MLLDGFLVVASALCHRFTTDKFSHFGKLVVFLGEDGLRQPVLVYLCESVV